MDNILKRLMLFNGAPIQIKHNASTYVNVALYMAQNK